MREHPQNVAAGNQTQITMDIKMTCESAELLKDQLLARVQELKLLKGKNEAGMKELKKRLADTKKYLDATNEFLSQEIARCELLLQKMEN